MENKIYFGACYYPEQWPKERIPQDIQMMVEAGINLVRLADLSWSVLEPEDGVFDFSIFDYTLDLLAQAGVEAILCTPTMVPPMWMWKKHPEIFATYPDGILQSDEIRSRNCHNSPIFAGYSRRITQKMAEHYQEHPAVVAWQVDNEANANKCCCPHCATAFRLWLQEKYGSLQALNQAWGTVFWSMVYSQWSQVAPPSPATELTIVASQQLDYQRFISDTTVKYLKEQVDILNQICPNHLTTHNGMTLFTNLNYYDLGRHLDFYGVDIYPAVDCDYIQYAMANDFSRGVKQDNFFVLEQKNGYFNYANYNLAIPPQWVTMWTLRDLARGANGVVYFRWRSGCYGPEQHPQGLLRHDGSPRRAYHEVGDLSKKIAPYTRALSKTKVFARVALLFSYDSTWALGDHVQNSRFSYMKLLRQYYEPFLRLGITVDVIEETQSLEGYDLVVAPGLFVGREDVAKNLEVFAEKGGDVILTPRCGIRNQAGNTVTQAWPGVFRDLAGVTVEEFDSLPGERKNTFSYQGQAYTGGCFLDVVSLDSAQALACYTQGFYAGSSAFSQNTLGKGRVFYSCVMDSPEFLLQVVEDIATEKGIPVTHCPPDVEITHRTGGDQVFTFVIHTAQGDRPFALDGSYWDVLTGEFVQSGILHSLDSLLLQSEQVPKIQFSPISDQ